MQITITTAEFVSSAVYAPDKFHFERKVFSSKLPTYKSGFFECVALCACHRRCYTARNSATFAVSCKSLSFWRVLPVLEALRLLLRSRKGLKPIFRSALLAPRTVLHMPNFNIGQAVFPPDEVEDFAGKYTLCPKKWTTN